MQASSTADGTALEVHMFGSFHGPLTAAFHEFVQTTAVGCAIKIFSDVCGHATRPSAVAAALFAPPSIPADRSSGSSNISPFETLEKGPASCEDQRTRTLRPDAAT